MAEKGLDFQQKVNEFLNAEPGAVSGDDGEDGNLADQFSIEAKNTERANVRAAMRQAEDQAEGKVPLVVLADKYPAGRRRPVQESLAVVRLGDFRDMVMNRPEEKQIVSMLNDRVLIWEKNGKLVVSSFLGGRLLIHPGRNDYISITTEE